MDDSDTSDGTNSAGSTRQVDESTSSKKRKTTYYARKDEIQLLQEQLKTLQAKLITMELKALSSHGPLANGILAPVVKQSSLQVAATQSLFTAYNLTSLQADGHVPLQDYIHLPKDVHARKAVLASMYEAKLLAALQFMNERTGFLDLRVTQQQVEQFELPNGDVGMIAMDITRFDRGHSLRQVNDALVFYALNQEISISEKLGTLTIRESEDIEEFKYGQARLLGTLPGGVEIESNVAMFTTCVDATEKTPAFMIGTIDFVNQDELYPYRTDKCLRRELTVAITMREIPSGTGDPPSIAMARWSYSRIPTPAFLISNEAKAAGLASLVQWCEIVPKIMKERLSTIVPVACRRSN